MRSFVFPYLAALFAMLIPDGVWLGVMANNLYRPAIGELMAPKFAPVPAVLYYLIYAVGLTILPESPTLSGSALRGMLLGLCAYGTYDLTNQATLRQWPFYLTLADMGWGTLLSGFAAFVAAYVRMRLR